jgi:hypothetical protein
MAKRATAPAGPLVAVDTMVLIWGMQPNAQPGDTKDVLECRIRSKILLELLTDQHATVVVPIVCVAELLVPIPPDKRGDFLTTLQAQFSCPPFDLPAASIAADLWQFQKSLPKEAQYSDRRLLRADLQIIASAKAAGATVFYSHDAKFRKVASHVMTAQELPKKHSDMFVDRDIRDSILGKPKPDPKTLA